MTRNIMSSSALSLAAPTLRGVGGACPSGPRAPLTPRRERIGRDCEQRRPAGELSGDDWEQTAPTREKTPAGRPSRPGVMPRCRILSRSASDWCCPCHIRPGGSVEVGQDALGAPAAPPPRVPGRVASSNGAVIGSMHTKRSAHPGPRRGALKAPRRYRVQLMASAGGTVRG